MTLVFIILLDNGEKRVNHTDQKKIIRREMLKLSPCISSYLRDPACDLECVLGDYL